MKGMSGAPTRIYDVHHARKAGWPTRGDPQGHGLPIVVGGWENQLQGEVGEVGECPEHQTGGKRNAPGDGLMSQDTGQEVVRRPRPQATGEPDAVKVARPVRRGAVGKVLNSNSLAAYPTLKGRGKTLTVNRTHRGRALSKNAYAGRYH